MFTINGSRKERSTWSNVVIKSCIEKIFYFLLSSLSKVTSMLCVLSLSKIGFSGFLFEGGQNWPWNWGGPPALMRSRFRTNVQHSVWRSKKSLISHILSFSWLNKHLFSTQSHWWYIFSCKQIIGGNFNLNFPHYFDIIGEFQFEFLALFWHFSLE